MPDRSSVFCATLSDPRRIFGTAESADELHPLVIIHAPGRKERKTVRNIFLFICHCFVVQAGLPFLDKPGPASARTIHTISDIAIACNVYNEDIAIAFV